MYLFYRRCIGFIEFVSIWDRYGIDLGSIRGQFGLLRCRFRTTLGPILWSPPQWLSRRCRPRLDGPGPEEGLNGRALDYPRGKVLGGCSSINGMIYMRGQSRDYDQWAQAGNPGWAWDDILPYFLKSEDQHAVPVGDMHARGGEWRVENPRVSWEIRDAFQDAAAQAGLPKTTDFNRGDNEGCGYFHVNQRRGVRVNTAGAFLKRAVKRHTLRLLTHAHATRIDVVDGRAVGLFFDVNGEPCHATANAEVILAAGSVASPPLLQHSGIGPGAVLLH